MGFIRRVIAVSVSLEHLSRTSNNKKASILSSTLDFAIEKLLKSQKSPSRKVGEIDNKGSHFYYQCIGLRN